MGINLNCIDFIYKNKFVKNKNIIFIGDHRISFNKFPNNLLKKYNLNSDINNDLSNSKKKGVDQKKFLEKLFKKFGYESLTYVDNFFSDTLDFKVNLSEENSYLNINKKFGIVVDNGTSIYASNIINSVNNVTNLVDDDGFYITNLDPMSFNRFPSQPSPERILDILTTKNFETNIFLEELSNENLSIKKRYSLNYYNKHNLIVSYLNFKQFFFHIIYLIINFFLSRMSKQSKIYSEDYITLKIDNFSKLSNRNKHNKLNAKIEKKPFIKNFFIYKILRNIFFKFNNFIENKGRVVITLISKKNNNLNLNLKENTSTIYYSILNDQ